MGSPYSFTNLLVQLDADVRILSTYVPLGKPVTSKVEQCAPIPYCTGLGTGNTDRPRISLISNSTVAAFAKLKLIDSWLAVGFGETQID